MSYKLGILSMIVIGMSFIVIIIFPNVLWTIFFGIGLLGYIIAIVIDDYEDDYDYGYGYDEGKKETTNEEKKPFIVKLKTTCPHCGAPMENDTCAYCGCKSEIYKVIQ